MMVERAPITQNFDQKILEDLDQATLIINTLTNKNQQQLSNQDLNNLIRALNKFNGDFQSSATSSGIFQGKNLVPSQQVKAGIEKALQALYLFQANQTDRGMAAQVNIGKAAVALFAKVNKEIEEFGKNLSKLRQLKKHRLGEKIENIGKSHRF